MKQFKGLFIFTIFTSLLLFFYSFTQVDLSLTLSKSSVYQSVEKWFQYIGYFNRPLSTELFIGILVLLFISYFWLLYLTHKKVISNKQFWYLLLIVVCILTFSYNAFSYDIFNNIFDAKIVTFYHQNPYLHKALDFPKDPMRSFMHWTQRTYPYGPLFLLLNIGLSYLGIKIFILTFFIFKIVTSLFFLGCIYYLQKILGGWRKETLFQSAFFAFNPLVIIESIVSSHNDVIMLFFALCGLYYLMKKKYLFAILLTLCSPLIKQATFLLPIIITLYILLNKKLSLNRYSIYAIYAVVMSIMLYVYTYIGYLLPGFAIHEIQPWYLLWVIPFIALLKPRYYLYTLFIGISLGLLLRYVPFLWLGNWDGVAIPVRNYSSLLAPLVVLGFGFIFRKYKVIKI